MEKGSAPIILLVGVILISSVILVSTQTNYLQNLISKPVPTQIIVPQITKSPTPVFDLAANWKTYTNTDFSFSIQYPPDWFAKRDDNSWNKNKQYLLLVEKGVEPASLPPLTDHLSVFNIRVSKYQFNKKDLEKTGTTENPADQNIPANNRNVYMPITFLGMPANQRIQQTGGVSGFYPETEIKFNAHGFAWDITYPNLDGTGKHDKIYDQILSTFKFTDKDQIADTSNWKTYNGGEAMKVTFKYPADWSYDPPYESCGPEFRPKGEPKFWIRLCQYPITGTASDWANGMAGGHRNQTTIKVDNHNAIRQESLDDSGTFYEFRDEVIIDDVAGEVHDGSQTRIVNQRTGTVLIELIVNDKTKIEQAKQFFDTILSTFKFTDQATDTSNWKTYTNSDLKISLKYPPSWKITEGNKQEPLTNIDFRPVSDEDQKIHSGIYLRYWNNPKKLSIKEYSKTVNSSNCALYDQQNDMVISMSDGTSAYFREKGFCEPLPAYFYTWAHGDKIFQLIDFLWQEEGDEQKTLKKMFTSVKYIN